MLLKRSTVPLHAASSIRRRHIALCSTSDINRLNHSLTHSALNKKIALPGTPALRHAHSQTLWYLVVQTQCYCFQDISPAQVRTPSCALLQTVCPGPFHTGSGTNNTNAHKAPTTFRSLLPPCVFSNTPESTPVQVYT